MEKQKNIPQLRFPDFKGEWEKKKLGDIISNKSQKYNPESNPESFKCIELEHLASETGHLLGYSDSQEAGSIKNRFEKGDVLFGKLRPYLRKYLLAPFTGVCSSEIWVLTGKKTSNEFIYRLIQTNRFIGLANQSSGSKMPRADWDVISSSLFYFPTLPEQQKIASFFTAIDHKISQLKRKKILLEQYKKGVMQKIFSQEIRFRDDNGQEFPKWEKKRLGDISNKKASTISANTIEENSGVYPIYGATGFLKKVDFFLEENDYISIVKDGAGVGRLLYCEGNSSVLGTLDIIRPKKGINTYFLYLLLSQIDFTKFITGSTIPHIYYKDYSKNSILMPCPKEQIKIANFLSAIDDKINHTEKQIEKAEVWKKGLMQQMFV